MAKALTICQPYAHLIARGDKRVENREWPTNYRGMLYIHAGKSRKWLDIANRGNGDFDMRYQIPLAEMAFGAVVAVATLVDCIHIDRIHRGECDKRHPWLREHEHTEGTWCWVLDNVASIGAWPWRGAQGLWNLDEDELGRVANKVLGIPEPSSASPSQEKP